MPDETDNKKQRYLKREEVRTMEKDMARLREQESETVREKIAQIRTGEEAIRESERAEEARKAAEERQKLGAEVERKEAELEKFKEEREQRTASAEAVATQDKETERETLRAQLRGAQSKEEEERRIFLEGVAAKAEGRTPEAKPYMPPSEPNVPTPDVGIPHVGIPPYASPEPSLKKPLKFSIPKIQLPKVTLPKIPTPKIAGYFPSKSSLFTKIWIRIIVSLFVLAILATLITFWYWYLIIRPQVSVPASPPPAAIQKPTPEEPKITQAFLGLGYYFPTAPRIIDTIIIHSGFNTLENDPYNIESIIQLYKTAKVATHYLIGRDGAIYQLAPDYAVTYHAGAGVMPDGRGGINNFSISINIIYLEDESPNSVQYQSLAWLAKNLREKYNIPTKNILGHKDIVSGKTTPWNFDWNFLSL